MQEIYLFLCMLFAHAVPARIDRNVAFPTQPPGTEVCGAGRQEMAQNVMEGNTVILFCPTTGTPDPEESWRLIATDARGVPSEGPLPLEDPRFDIS